VTERSVRRGLSAWLTILTIPAVLAAWSAPALCADLAPAPPPAYFPPAGPDALSAAPPNSLAEANDPYRYELRFGAFAHGVGGAEHNTFDLNPEFVFPRLPVGQASWWNVLIPRPHLGGLINLDGRTSSVYGGALWTFPLPHRFFAELFLDGEKHNGYTSAPPPGRSNLGCPFLFHDGGSVGYSLDQHWSVMFTFDHQSNGRAIFGTECGGLGAKTSNQGINDYGLRVGYSF
jgi:lipid A 3-O-deacylase